MTTPEHMPYPLFTPTPSTAFYDAFLRPQMSEARVRMLLKLVAARMYDYGFADGIHATEVIEQKFVLTEMLKIPMEINAEPARRAKALKPEQKIELQALSM